jgi:hypothetical protein
MLRKIEFYHDNSSKKNEFAVKPAETAEKST